MSRRVLPPQSASAKFVADFPRNLLLSLFFAVLLALVMRRALMDRREQSAAESADRTVAPPSPAPSPAAVTPDPAPGSLSAASATPAVSPDPSPPPPQPAASSPPSTVVTASTPPPKPPGTPPAGSALLSSVSPPATRSSEDFDWTGLPPQPGELYPETRQTILTPDSPLLRLSRDQLQYAINEILARHHIDFAAEHHLDAAAQFNPLAWAKPAANRTESDVLRNFLSDREHKNYLMLAKQRNLLQTNPNPAKVRTAAPFP